MRQKVCMFVWNHFTNDARVMRECLALSEEQYQVDLICIHNPDDPNLLKIEEYNPYFKVYRVPRYPYLLTLLQKSYKKSLDNKFFIAPFLLVWLILLYFLPLWTLVVTSLLLVLFKTKIKLIWIRANIFLHMIRLGIKKDYNIYHSNDLNTLPQGYICSKVRFKQRKLIYDSHEVQTSRTGYNSKLYVYLEAFLIKKIDSMIVENHTRARYAKKVYKFYPNVVYNYPIKIDAVTHGKVSLKKILGLPESEKILLYQGGIQTGRGLENLIKAAPLFKEGTLVLIGDGRIKRDLEKLVDQMGLKEKVRFLPKVPLKDLPLYTREAYIGFQVLNNVCFNHYSAASNKLFEYIMSYVPVIACSFPEIKKVIQGEGIGLCVDSHDPVSIAKGVNYLLDSPEEYQVMKKKCAIAREKYNWEYEKVNFLTVYKNIKAS